MTGVSATATWKGVSLVTHLPPPATHASLSASPAHDGNSAAPPSTPPTVPPAHCFALAAS
jgi:hypothetical protein